MQSVMFVMSKIVAVIVTYNRCELLKRCLDYLKGQSRQVDEIVVINNGSTDDTEAMLAARNVRCITQENLGSAGGWSRGIEYALAEGFDAVWLMDDDGYPEQEALKSLEQSLEPGVACVSSVVLCEDDHESLVFPFPVLDKRGLPVLFAQKRKINTLSQVSAIAKNGVYAFAHLFNGALVSTEAIRNVGNVNRDFFMSGDEIDYFYRLRKYGAVFSVLTAHHYHPDVGDRPFTPIKVYYYIKNTLILNKLYFNQVFVRDLLSILAVLGRAVARNGLFGALSYIAGKNAPTFYSAIARGKLRRLGKDFDG
jgi:rhamnopyranosyl-N-acetylglucosaminyl-diphospho-decaprenol beta-1,3/1,4-galactofuranosyltransferase